MQAEKKKMIQRQQMLEEKIKTDWAGLRKEMKPASVVKGLFSGILPGDTGNRTASKTFFKGLLSVGGALLVKKLIRKTWASFFTRK